MMPSNNHSLVLHQHIEEAVQLLQDYPSISNFRMMELLQELDYGATAAAQMVAYIPMAYLRVLLAPKEVVFPPTCIFYNGNGDVWEVNLQEEPLFQAALDYARAHLGEGMRSERALAIMLRSCELGPINEALHEGIPPGDLELFPGQFDLDGDKTPLLE